MNDQQQTESVPEYGNVEMKMPQSDIPMEPKKSPWHLIIFLGLLLVLAGVLGGLYLWSTMLTSQTAPLPVAERPTDEQNNEPESTTAEAEADTMMTVSSSDELSSIEADLEATQFDDLSDEFVDIEATLDAEAQ